MFHFWIFVRFSFRQVWILTFQKFKRFFKSSPLRDNGDLTKMRLLLTIVPELQNQQQQNLADYQ
jgi:hypothetical protein